MSDFLSLLGRPVHGHEVTNLLQSTGERPEVVDVLGDGNVDMEFKSSGFSLSADTQGIVQVVHIRLEPREGYEPYNGVLPCNLISGQSRDEVLAVMGTPTASGGGNRDPQFGDIIPLWLSFNRGAHVVHFEFGRDDKGRERIAMVTLMTAEAAPG